MTVRVALVGCGSFAASYHLPALLASRTARLVAICDPAPSPAASAGAAAVGATVVADLRDVLADDACDAVVVSTPHALHADHVAAALDAGKHVLVDKPFVLRTADADALAARAAARGLVAAVAFNRRFDRAYLDARDALAAEEGRDVACVESVQLGYPLHGWYVDPALGGGGPFVGRLAHLADAVPWLLGRPVVRVRARLADEQAGGVDAGGWLDAELEGGVSWRATTLARGFHMWDEVRIFTDGLVVGLRRPVDSLLEWRGERQAARDGEATALGCGRSGTATEDFVAAVASGRRPAATFEHARASVRIVEAAYESARAAGVWVRIDEQHDCAKTNDGRS